MPGLFGMETRGSSGQACCLECAGASLQPPLPLRKGKVSAQRGTAQRGEGLCRVWQGFAVAGRADEWSLGAVSLPGYTMDV